MFHIRDIRRRLGSLTEKLNLKKRNNEYVLLLEKSEHGQGRRRVPKGIFPIYVGEERKLYMVPVGYITSSGFQALLNEVEYDFDAKIEGPLTLPCSIQTFEWVLDQYLSSYGE